jgi:hypothetical protein
VAGSPALLGRHLGRRPQHHIERDESAVVRAGCGGERVGDAEVGDHGGIAGEEKYNALLVSLGQRQGDVAEQAHQLGGGNLAPGESRAERLALDVGACCSRAARRSRHSASSGTMCGWLSRAAKRIFRRKRSPLSGWASSGGLGELARDPLKGECWTCVPRGHQKYGIEAPRSVTSAQTGQGIFRDFRSAIGGVSDASFAMLAEALKLFTEQCFLPGSGRSLTC